MKFSQLIAFTAIAAAGLSAWAAPDPAVELGLPAEAAAAMGSIDAERIRAHVKFLADDLLEGRGTGTQALNAKQTVNWLSGDEFEPIRLQGNAVH
jgi:hypothetical protein